MSEKDSENHVFSYMDGIPVKISEKYKPPRKVVLPFGFQNRLLQPPFSPDYDFQLEQDVLDKLQLWRSQRFKEKEKRKQRLADKDAERKKMQETMEELKKTMNELSADDDTVCSQNSPQPPSPVSPAPVPLQQNTKHSLPSHPSVCSPVISEENPILRPVPIKHQGVSSQINNNKPISAFNLSDFEADTSSPFDNMELKTINDLEELAQVLQPVGGSTAITQMPGYYQNTPSSDESFVNMHHQTMNSQVNSTEQSFNVSTSNKMLNDTKCGINYQPHVNGFSSNYDYNSMQSYLPQSVIPHLNPHGQAAAYNYAERAKQQPREVSFSYLQQDNQRQLQTYYSANVWPSMAYQQTRQEPSSFSTVMSKEGSAASSNLPVFNLSSSSGVHQDSAEEGSPEGDSDPSINAVAQQLGNLMKSRASRNQPKPSEESTPETSSSVHTPTSPTEVDPFESLQPESKHLVQKIAEMGFPRARVARTCLRFGSNDKKVVEFLLSLQSLLDAGYQESLAEHALSLHKEDVKVAVKFLQAESQLLDLGFPVDRVSEALMKFNCDRDQALEFLISQ